jgi:hypothetical protein
MRKSILLCVVLVMTSIPAFAQVEWMEFVSKEDRFSTNFPGTPAIMQTTYRSQFGADLPARVYTASSGPSRYKLTVVDYRDIEKILAEKSKSCPPGAEVCRGGYGSTGPGYSWADRAGAMIHASWQFIQRDGTVTEYIWNNINQVTGHQVFLNNADKSRTVAGIYMHDDFLYIAEGTVPAGYPNPEVFIESLAFLDSQGNNIRYDSHYVNGQIPPTSRPPFPFLCLARRASPPPR